VVDKPVLTVFNCISYSAYLKVAFSIRKLRARLALVIENNLTCRLSEVSLCSTGGGGGGVYGHGVAQPV
jgi:hypothetical protein